MWDAIVISLIFSLISYALQPRPKTHQPTPGQLEFPRTDQSATIPVVFGTVLIKEPTVVWYGDLSTKKIKA